MIEWPALPSQEEDPIFWNILSRDREASFGCCTKYQDLNTDCSMRVFPVASLSFGETKEIGGNSLIIKVGIEVEFNYWSLSETSWISFDKSCDCREPFIEDTEPLEFSNFQRLFDSIDHTYAAVKMRAGRVFETLACDYEPRARMIWYPKEIINPAPPETCPEDADL